VQGTKDDPHAFDYDYLSYTKKLARLKTVEKASAPRAASWAKFSKR